MDNRVIGLLNYPITCVLLSDPAPTDELGPRNRQASRIAAKSHGWRNLIQRPPRCFVAARNAAKRHALLLKVQHRVVTVQTAERLTQPFPHADAKPLILRRCRGRPQTLARRHRLGIVRDHGVSRSSCDLPLPILLDAAGRACGSGDFKSRAVMSSLRLSAGPLRSCAGRAAGDFRAGVFRLVSAAWPEMAE